MIKLLYLLLPLFITSLTLDHDVVAFDNSKRWNDSNDNKMATIVLNQRFRVVDQLKSPHSIYIVSYNFDLSGEAIYIPADCELRFDGGSFSNGTLIGNNTIITSPDRKCFDHNIHFQGTWLGPFYISWLCEAGESDDLGVALNIVQSSFKHIIIPHGVYSIKTAAVLSDIQLDWYGSVYYTGVAEEIDLVTLTSVCDLNMSGSLSGKGSVVRGGRTAKTDIHGLVIKNCANSRLDIGNIDWFNVGLEIVGDDAGCAYNTFNLTSVRDCNINLLVTQRKKNKSIGYANENLFIGGRFGHSTDWIKAFGTAGNISIACKSNYYKDDVYKSVNSLTFIKQCLEDAEDSYAIVLDNAVSCSFNEIRLEGNKKNNIKLNGKCGNLYFSSSFGQLSFDLSDLTVRDNMPLFSNRFIIENCMPLSYQLTAESADESIVSGDVIMLKHRYINYVSSRLEVVPSNDLRRNVDGNVDNMGFRIRFDGPLLQQKYVRLIVHKKGDLRTNVYCKASEKAPGVKIRNQEDNSFYRVVSLFYNGKYDRWASGTNVQDVAIWPKEDVNEVTFMLENAYSATIVTNGYLAPALTNK